MAESFVRQRFCFGMVSITSLSLSMRGRYKNETAEWKCRPITTDRRRTGIVVICWLPKFQGFKLAPLFY